MSSCELPTPVQQIHAEYRFDNPRDGGDYRIVAVDIGDTDRIAIATKAADSNQASTEISFTLPQAQFYACRILAGDIEAARRPGMSRLLAAALITCLKILVSRGLLVEVEPVPDTGEGDDG